MSNRKCKKCAGDFAPTQPRHVYCEKCREKSKRKRGPAAPVARPMPVKANFCYHCGMPQPKEVIL